MIRLKLSALALVAALTLAGACESIGPAVVTVNPTAEQVALDRDRAVKGLTAITAGLAIVRQSLEVADELEKNGALQTDVLRRMAEGGKSLAVVTDRAFDFIEAAAGGERINLQTTYQAVLLEFDKFLAIQEGAGHGTLTQLAKAIRAVLALMTIGGIS